MTRSASTSPLQVVLFLDPSDETSLDIQRSLVAALTGARDSTLYLPTAEDLGIQLRVFSAKTAPLPSPKEVLADFEHTVFIGLFGFKFLKHTKSGLWRWLDAAAKSSSPKDGLHRFLPFLIDENAKGEIVKKAPSLDLLQFKPVHEFGERALRASLLTLRVLHELRLVLTPTQADGALAPMQIFISHAKVDGLPLAQSRKHQIAQLPWLSKFYDAEDIPTGADWREKLEEGVASSIVVMFRTEHYDQRHWCQQEVLWADEYAVPAVLVDARTGLNHPAGTLPFDRLPALRIPDGNLLRVLFIALREGLRYLLFHAKVEAMKRAGQIPPRAIMKVFCCAPSMPALYRACQLLAQDKKRVPKLILYPDPPLRVGSLEAALALVKQHAPRVRLATPQGLAAAPLLP